jgi:hypothetical protein
VIARAFVLVVALLAFAATALGQSTRIRDYAGFYRENDQRLELTERKSWEIEIDEQLQVKWMDKEALVEALRAQLPLPSEGASDEVDADIHALQAAATHLVAAQDLFQQAADARLGTEGTPEQREIRARALEGEAAPLAGNALRALTRFRERAPRAYNELLESMKVPFEQRFIGLATLIRGRLDAVAAEIQRRSIDLEVRMEAYVRGEGGSNEPVEVTGYFTPKDRQRYPFKRFQTLVDQRTKNSFAAAQALADVLKPLESQETRRRLHKELQVAVEELRKLLDQILQDDFPRHLEQLSASVKDLAETNSEIAALRTAIDGFLRGIAALQDLRDAAKNPTLDDVLALFDDIGKRWIELRSAVTNVPKATTILIDNLRGVLDSQAALLGTDLTKRLADHLDTLRTVAPELSTLVSRFGTLLGRVRVSGEIALGMKEIDRVARSLNSADLDTEIVTDTAKERRPGDRLYVRIWVVRADETDPSKALTSDGFSFRLRTLGFYTEFEGGLIFADPRGTVPRDQDFAIAPAISYNLKYGMKDASFWNDVLNPGLGISFALLDFEDESSLEIGIAGNLTLFNDLVWVGYGRNLQAEADYFYVGVNPLAIADLVQRDDKR